MPSPTTPIVRPTVLAAILFLGAYGFGCGGGTGEVIAVVPPVVETPATETLLPEPSETTGQLEVADVPVLLDLTDVLPDIEASEVETFETIMRNARLNAVHRLPMDSLVQWVGLQFLDAPYVGGMLDESDSEVLVVSFQKFDCVLFIETVIAIADGIAAEDYSGGGFVRRLEDLRYRQGINSGYASRLHYFSDWMHDNQQMGYVQDVTTALGGTRRTKTLNIMSKHPRLYRRLRHNNALRTEIANMEQQLNEIPKFYVPQVRLPYALGQIKPGDIVSTATVARGLDVSHSGFAFRNPDGSIGLLHASSASGKVIITPSLSDYVTDNRLVEGIVVARPVGPVPDLTSR